MNSSVPELGLKMKSIKFCRSKTLAKEIVILDGLTGTGKTMFSPLLASFEGMQNPRFEYIFEYLSIAELFGKLDSDAASALANLLVDQKYYDGAISRDVNFRPSDLSGVLANGNLFKYIRQLFMQDGESAHLRLSSSNQSLLLVTHQLIKCARFIEGAFSGRVKIVEMVRHPLYLLEHWHTYIDMHGVNPRDLTVWLSWEGESLPWFAAGWEEKYAKSTSFDRVIYSIDFLMSDVFDIAQMDNDRPSVLFIPFEHFVLNPESHLLRLEQFLGKALTPGTYKHLKKQNVPRDFIWQGVNKKIYQRYGFKESAVNLTHSQDYDEKSSYAQSMASPEAFCVLKKCMKRYEDVFGTWI